MSEVHLYDNRRARGAGLLLGPMGVRQSPLREGSGLRGSTSTAQV